MVFKTLFRTIRASLGRYIAILAIVALGVGFFTGLKSAQPSMQATADRYFDAQQMYDFQLVSSLGLTSGDVEAPFRNGRDPERGRRVPPGGPGSYRGRRGFGMAVSFSAGAYCPSPTDSRPDAGAEGECLADDSAFSEDDIGKTITVSSENEETTFSQLTPDRVYDRGPGTVAAVHQSGQRKRLHGERRDRRLSLSAFRSLPV